MTMAIGIFASFYIMVAGVHFAIGLWDLIEETRFRMILLSPVWPLIYILKLNKAR